MPLSNIPALPEDHPLFDWSEHQSSRDALVKGTPTKHFAKEAWNAIVDSLSEALTVAGLEWDDTYTTAEGAKITAAYGKLTAQKFNSVRHNIDWPAPLGWAWARYPDFRGYVGRENFRGRATHRKSCDRVYPEYIIELARKLNLLLEIMRETAPLADAEMEYLGSANIQAETFSRPAAHVATDHISKLLITPGIDSRPGASVEVSQKSSSQVSAEIDPHIAAEATYYRNVPLLIKAEGHPRESAPLELENLLFSVKVTADMETNICAETGAEILDAFVVEALADTAPSLPMEAGATPRTIHKVELLQKESQPMECQVYTGSLPEAEILPKLRLPLASKVLTASRVSVDVEMEESAAIEAAEAEIYSGSVCDAEIIPGESASVETGCLSKVNIAASVAAQQPRALGGVALVLAASAVGRTDETVLTMAALRFRLRDDVDGSSSQSKLACMDLEMLTRSDAEIQSLRSRVNMAEQKLIVDSLAQGRTSKSSAQFGKQELRATPTCEGNASLSRENLNRLIIRMENVAKGRITPTVTSEIQARAGVEVNAAAHNAASRESEAGARLRQGASVTFHCAKISEPVMPVDIRMTMDGQLHATPAKSTAASAEVQIDSPAVATQSPASCTVADEIVEILMSGDMRSDPVAPHGAAYRILLETRAPMREPPSHAQEYGAAIRIDGQLQAVQPPTNPTKMSGEYIVKADATVRAPDTDVVTVCKHIRQDAVADLANAEVDAAAAKISIGIDTGKAELEADNSGATDQVLRCNIHSSVALNVWAKPVQNGSNLLIRQAYDTIQEGSNLLII